MPFWNPQTQAAAIGAAGSVAGSIIGKSSGRQNRTNAWNNAYLNIPLTVKGARAAGIHPLYALGASQNIQPSQTIPGQNDVGTAVGTGVASVANAWAKGKRQSVKDADSQLMQNAQLRVLESQANRNEAEAALALSQSARTAQNVNHQQDTNAMNLHEMLPAQVTHSRPADTSTAAGPAIPGRTELVTGHDRWGYPKKRRVHQATQEEWSVGFDIENAFNEYVLHPYGRAADRLLDLIIRQKHGDFRKTRPHSRR